MLEIDAILILTPEGEKQRCIGLPIRRRPRRHYYSDELARGVVARIRGINTKYYVGRGHDGEAAVSSLLEGRPSRRPRSHRGRAVVGASGGPRIRMTAALDSGKKVSLWIKSIRLGRQSVDDGSVANKANVPPGLIFPSVSTRLRTPDLAVMQPDHQVRSDKFSPVRCRYQYRDRAPFLQNGRAKSTLTCLLCFAAACVAVTQC